MRAILIALTLLLITPLAAARPDLPDVSGLFDDDGGANTVGPCTVGYGLYWPGRVLSAECGAAGFYLAAASLGWNCGAHVAGRRTYCYL